MSTLQDVRKDTLSSTEARIQIVIEGITPLILNRFTDEAALAATSGQTRTSGAGDRGSPQDQAIKKLYVGSDGQTLVIPQPNLFRSIMEGGRFFKIGKKQITTQKSSLIPAFVDLPSVEYPIIHKDPWTVDERPVRIPSTGGRILCYRPKFNDWRIEFEAVLDAAELGVILFRKIVDAAGRRIGLGDFRPDCKGPFGKFVVTFWEVLETATGEE